jgi:hypothetical protein
MHHLAIRNVAPTVISPNVSSIPLDSQGAKTSVAPNVSVLDVSAQPMVPPPGAAFSLALSVKYLDANLVLC